MPSSKPSKPSPDAQTRQARNANRSRRDIGFQIGDQVLLSTSNLRTVTGLQPRWIGPFPVKSIINPVAVQLDLPKTFRMYSSFHVSQIKHYKTSIRYPDRNVNRPPPVSADSASPEPEYEVERILAHRKVLKDRAAGSIQYLVKWVGYPMYDCTWEPRWHLANAQERLAEYRAESEPGRIMSPAI